MTACKFLCLTQCTSKAAIKKFGKCGEAAGLEEMQQLHDRKVFTPVDWKELTKEQQQSALESSIFIKEKRDGRLKGRSCTDGRKQRDLHTKEETAGLTVAMESVFLTAAMEGKEI